MALGPGGLPPGAFSRTLFVSFHVVSFLYSFGYFSFLCLENCPWKLSKGAFSRTLFLFFRFCIVLAMFPSFALKIDLGNCTKALFLEPFSFFSFFFSFAFKIDLEIVKRSSFSNLSCFFLLFFVFFLLCLQT